jgi:hypothetical protein
LNKNFVTTLTTTGTALLSLSFVFATTAQEVLGSCIFLFVKHPFDIGDRVDITKEQLVVERISLLFTVFKRVQSGNMCQIPNIVLNGLWVDNITRSKAMREQLTVNAHYDTTFEDIQLLKQEMQRFVRDKDNSRDFQPDIDIDVLGFGDMNKMELRVEIKHKSNWSNEAIRAARRSKFMCALVLALKRVPIYAPGGGAAALGSSDAPSYSVSLSPDQAKLNKDAFAAAKEAKKLVPTAPSQAAVNTTTTPGYTTGFQLGAAVENLTSRNPARDPSRDETWQNRDDVSTLDERRSMDRGDGNSERGLLRETSRGGRRAPHQTPQGPHSSVPQIHEQQLPPRGASNVNYALPQSQLQFPPRLGGDGSSSAQPWGSQSRF